MILSKTITVYGLFLSALLTATANAQTTPAGQAAQPVQSSQADQTTDKNVTPDPLGGLKSEPGFAQSFYTFGGVASNQLGTANSSSAAQYVDFGWRFHWLNEGLGQNCKSAWPPGINTSFSGRFSTMPVAGKTATTQASTTSTTPFNILTTQESARIMASFSLPTRVMRPVPTPQSTPTGTSAIFLAPVVRGSFSTLLNPSQTVTASTGTSATVQYAPTYNDWSVGGQVGLRYYPDKTDGSHDEVVTVAQLDVTLGKFSNLPSEECGSVITSSLNAKAPTNTSCFQPIVAAGKTTYNYLSTGRVSVPRLELDGFYKIVPGPLVIGIDANLSQYKFFMPTRLDTMNRSGSDVRIYFGVSGNLGDLCTQLKLCSK